MSNWLYTGDLGEELRELEAEVEAAKECPTCAGLGTDPESVTGRPCTRCGGSGELANPDLSEIDTERLEALKELRDEIGESEFDAGQSLIPDYGFEEYAQQFADDIGAVDLNAGWPTSHIDWKAAADDLKTDFSEVEFDGTTYYWRA